MRVRSVVGSTTLGPIANETRHKVRFRGDSRDSQRYCALYCTSTAYRALQWAAMITKSVQVALFSTLLSIFIFDGALVRHSGRTRPVHAVAPARARAGVSDRAGQSDPAAAVGGRYGGRGAFAWAGIPGRRGARGRVLQFCVLGVRLPAHGHHRPGGAGARRGRCAGAAGQRRACAAAGAGHRRGPAGAARGRPSASPWRCSGPAMP